MFPPGFCLGVDGLEREMTEPCGTTDAERGWGTVRAGERVGRRGTIAAPGNGWDGGERLRRRGTVGTAGNGCGAGERL
jgi:hypothetical protein